MKIYESAVRNPISTILIFVGVIVLGLFSLRNLAIDMYPDMDFPSISVITTYKGANAADIEVNVTRILEDRLNTVNNLKKITSKSSDNVSMITLEFEWGSDLNEATNDVRDAVSLVQSSLPDDVDYPTIFKFSSTMIPVVVLGVTADESYAALYKLLDDRLVNVLNRVDGVGAVSVMGAPTRQVQVNIDPKRLEAYNLSVEQIGSVIAAENVNVPGGTLDIGNNTFNIKADAEFTNSDQVADIVIASFNGRDIRVRDVATVRDTLEKETYQSRLNGEKGVRVIIQKQSGANTVSIANEVLAMMPAIQKSLPADVKISTIMDSSDSIKDSISSLSDTVMFAFVFVVLVVLFFLGRWRATFIICLTIPVSLIVSFIYLYFTGSTLNIISLSSLSIAIGMVVDDAIVVLENITSHIEKGSSPKEAAVYATNEVWLAVIATTLTVVAVFLPLTMVGGMMGIMFKELGWIVSLVVVVSTAAAITLTPMLSAYLLKAETAHSYKGLGVVFKPIDKFLDWLDNFYEKVLTWSVRHRSFIIIASTLIFFSSFGLLRTVPFDFFPESDEAFMQAEVQLEQNTGVVFTAQLAEQITGIITTKYPEIEVVSSGAGTSSANNAFAAMQKSGSYVITYMMRLSKSGERERSIFEIGDLLREDLKQIPEIRDFKVTTSSSTPGGSTSPIMIKVFGYDFNQTDAIAREIKEKVSLVEGAKDVQLSRDDLRPEYNVEFDRNKLGYYGVNSYTASMAIYNRLTGLTSTKYREDGDEYDVIVRYDEPYRESLESVEDITIHNNKGVGVKVRDLAQIKEEFAPPTIERENRQRVVSVNASLGAGVPLGKVVPAIQQIVAETQLPEGVYVEIGGTVEDQQEAFGDLITLLGLIVLLVYIVMATQFESLGMPAIIMVSILFAFTGVFLGLAITQTPLSVIALIGAIMLVGIVVKNGIVMVDFTNLLRERGQGVNQAVINAGKSRLRPVLMTSLTTILGMFPLALKIGEGSEIWQPMGIAIIGGLTFSTLLTLIVVPVIYSVFVGSGMKAKRRRQLAAEATN